MFRVIALCCYVYHGGVLPDGHPVVDCGLRHNPLFLEDHGRS